MNVVVESVHCDYESNVWRQCTILIICSVETWMWPMLKQENPKLVKQRKVSIVNESPQLSLNGQCYMKRMWSNPHRNNDVDGRQKGIDNNMYQWIWFPRSTEKIDATHAI